LDLITATELPAGFLALSEDAEQIIVIGLIAVGVATVAVLALRSRRESERILEALSEDRRV
jgi:hypothetical protein